MTDPTTSTEKVYFQHGDILVSSSRFVSGSQTFAMRNVSSVQKAHTSPSIVAPVIIGALGLIAFSGAPMVGILVIGAAIGWFWYTASKHTVQLTAAGAVQVGLESRDEQLIQEVVAALNQAIIDRG